MVVTPSANHNPTALLTQTEVAILRAPGLDADAVEDVATAWAASRGAPVRVLEEAPGVLELGRRCVVIAALGARLGGSFEDLVGLRFAEVPWLAVIPATHPSVLPDLCRDAGATDVLTVPEVRASLKPAIERAVDRDGSSQTPVLTPPLLAMLTHLLGLTARIELEHPSGHKTEFAVCRGMPWSGRSTTGRRGQEAVLEALRCSSTKITVAQRRDGDPRNIFATWPDLLRRFGTIDRDIDLPINTAKQAALSDLRIRPVRVLQDSPPGPAQVPASHQRSSGMPQVDLKNLTDIDGFVGACLVDSDSGMVLGQEGGGGLLNLEVAAAGNTEVVRAKRKTMKSLRLNDKINDILITLDTQYHLIRPLGNRDSLFLYLALDRKQANLAMARLSLKDFEQEVNI